MSLSRSLHNRYFAAVLHFWISYKGCCGESIATHQPQFGLFELAEKPVFEAEGNCCREYTVRIVAYARNAVNTSYLD